MSPPRDKTACQTSPCKCKICSSSIESDVYHKKKIQMSENMYISFVPISFTRWNKSPIHSKHSNILYISLCKNINKQTKSKAELMRKTGSDPGWFLSRSIRFNYTLYSRILNVFGKTVLSKQCWPRSDATASGVWSGSSLYTTHPAFYTHSKVLLKRSTR